MERPHETNGDCAKGVLDNGHASPINACAKRKVARRRWAILAKALKVGVSTYTPVAQVA